jgi:hypothetical protein
MDSFVYCWTDRLTHKLYVGFHKGTPDDGYICSSKHMKKEYKERPMDFTRQILATGDYDICRNFENAVIRAMFTQNIPCYNLNVNGAILYTPEIRAKISATHKGKIISASHRKAISEWSKNRPPASDETREKIRRSKLGVKRGPMSDEQKKKISESGKGLKRPEGFGAAITARQLGSKRKNPYPESAKEKNRIASTGKKHSHETLAKLKVAKSNISEETKCKMSEARKAFWAKKRGESNA